MIEILKRVNLNKKFRLLNDYKILQFTRKDARKISGIMHVQVEGKHMPTFWIDWNTQVEIIEEATEVEG